MSVWLWIALALIALRIIAVAIVVALTPFARHAPAGQVDPCLGPFIAPPHGRLTSAEGMLCARLTAGTIGRDDYQRQMAALAAVDEQRHPFVLPPQP